MRLGCFTSSRAGQTALSSRQVSARTWALARTYLLPLDRESISALINIQPEYANVLRDGNMEKVDPEEVSVGDLVVILPGEKIPLDGTVVE